MLVFNSSRKKNKSVKSKSARFIKIVASGLAMYSLLSLSVFAHPMPAQVYPVTAESGNTGEANQSIQELPPNSPSVPESAVVGTRLLYTTISKSSEDREPLQFTISATDADGDELSYSAANLPEGATFDPDTQTFSWTPRYNQAGVYSVHFEVSDGSLTDSEDITITVVQVSEDWDVNGDDIANVLDMILVGQHWGETGLTGWTREDANEDGAINVLDMIVIGQHWNIQEV
jgi:hypothetical protein